MRTDLILLNNTLNENLMMDAPVPTPSLSRFRLSSKPTLFILLILFFGFRSLAGGDMQSSHYKQFNCRLIAQMSPPQEIYRAKVKPARASSFRVSFAAGEALSSRISQKNWINNIPLLGVLDQTVSLKPRSQYYSLRVHPQPNGLVKTDEVLFVRNSTGEDLLLKVTHNGDPLAESPFEAVQFLKLKCETIL